MPASLRSLLAAAVVFASLTCIQSANVDTALTGTWTTKSRKVVTGPGFYDPVGERMFEPDLTGISYSFTDDGWYEEAYYRAISNPTDPACPRGIIQWQHGQYQKNTNGSLTLTPISVDGRQLLSDPCTYKNSIYTRYNQFELIKSYLVDTDAYNKAQRLQLYQFDGTPLNPMYLAYKPPQMLPTQTMNPTNTAATGSAKSTGKAKRNFNSAAFEKVKRDIDGGGSFEEPLNKHLMEKRSEPFNADKWWWIGVGMTALGGVGYYCF